MGDSQTPSGSPQSTYRVVVVARVPCASVFWDSWFDLLSLFVVGIPPVHLQFPFRSSLGPFSVWSEEGSRLRVRQEQLFCKGFKPGMKEWWVPFAIPQYVKWKSLIFKMYVLNLYTVSGKNGTNNILGITLTKFNNFHNFWHNSCWHVS